MTCRVRYIYQDGSEYIGPAIGNPADLEAAAFDAGAIGVTVMVLS